MKNVRLFAVAAAMGMFASTVAAAETTQPTYSVTWGEVDEIVKVDVGDKVIAPTSTIKVVKTTRTDDITKANKDTLGLVTDVDCYKGWTPEVGEDANADGMVDAPMYFTTGSWITNTSKFFPSVKTALYYIGATEGTYGVYTGGYFLAPGQAEKEDFYASDVAHKQFGEAEAVVEWLESEGKVSFHYDLEGNFDYATINTLTVTDKDGNVKGEWETRLVAGTSRKAEDYVTEAIPEIFLQGTTAYAASKEYKDLDKAKYFEIKTVYYAHEAKQETGKEAKLEYYIDLEKGVKVKDQGIYLVEEYKGEYSIAEVTTATPSDAANKVIAAPASGKIQLVVANDDEETFSKLQTVEFGKVTSYARKTVMVWSAEHGTFVPYELPASDKAVPASEDGYYWGHKYVDTKSTEDTIVVAEALEVPAHALGLVKLNTPENTTDLIVIATENITDYIHELNIKNGTMSLKYDTDAKGNAVVVNTKYAKLDGVYYPAVENVEQLAKVIEKLALTKGDGKLDAFDDKGAYTTNSFGVWREKFDKDVAAPLTGITNDKKIVTAEGKEVEYSPENSLQHYTMTFCTYAATTDAEEVTTATVTSDAASIDTSVAGVKTMTLSANLDGKVIDTKEVKVVVAPKYERVYKNGKVVKLTAKWLNGNTYAVYNYDWAAKTVTATFYEQDGVTVADTATTSL